MTLRCGRDRSILEKPLAAQHETRQSVHIAHEDQPSPPFQVNLISILPSDLFYSTVKLNGMGNNVEKLMEGEIVGCTLFNDSTALKAFKDHCFRPDVSKS